MDILEIVGKQRSFFKLEKTLSIDFRKRQLAKLLELLKANEKKLYEAIYADFRKSEFDTFATELGIIYAEINYFIKNIDTLAKKRKVKTNLANLPAKSYQIAEPYGVTLVIGAWNYPYQLSILPAITSIAAGNTVVLKPSEIAANTSRIMAEIVNGNFAEDFFHVVEGGVEVSKNLLSQRWDFIFFTGSTHVGKIVYKAAAEHLTPVVLELGGKSPAIVLADADLKTSAKRIVWGKFLNAGQTCIAPDYVYVSKFVKQKLVELMKGEIEKRYPILSGPSPEIPSIINLNNYNRLKVLMAISKIIFGGIHDDSSLFISPTLFDSNFDELIMQSEIFGPLLPIVEFDDEKEIFASLNKMDKPLALYLFTSNKTKQADYMRRLSFGGGAVNDTIMHIANPNLPFGGVGNSGIGSYHGKDGFEVFSHFKSVLVKNIAWEPEIKYPPYTASKLSWIKRLLK